MKVKAVAGALLLTFAAVSLVIAVVKEVRGGVPAANQPAPARQVIVYYFHGYKRCESCLAVETLTGQALARAFPEALRDGRLAWRVVNREEAGNAHYVTELHAGTNKVVVANLRAGQVVAFKELRDVWRLLDDRAAFAAYIESESRAFLEAP